jgi:Ulp1 family protease
MPSEENFTEEETNNNNQQQSFSKAQQPSPKTTSNNNNTTKKTVDGSTTTSTNNNPSNEKDTTEKTMIQKAETAICFPADWVGNWMQSKNWITDAKDTKIVWGLRTAQGVAVAAILFGGYKAIKSLIGNDEDKENDTQEDEELDNA